MGNMHANACKHVDIVTLSYLVYNHGTNKDGLYITGLWVPVLHIDLLARHLHVGVKIHFSLNKFKIKLPPAPFSSPLPHVTTITKQSNPGFPPEFSLLTE